MAYYLFILVTILFTLSQSVLPYRSDDLSSDSGKLMHDLKPPVIISEPPNQVMLKRGSNHTLKCHARGEPAPRFQWYKDSDNDPMDEEDYKGKIKIEHYGSSDTALTLIGFDETLQGNYYCKAKNPLGQVGSMGTKLIIPFLNEKFGKMEELVYVADLTSPELECEPPLGNPPPTVSWQKDGRPIQIDGTQMKTTDNGKTLTIVKANVSEHQGLYTCVASNIAGTQISPHIKLVIEKPPMFIKLPQKEATYNEGMNFTIPCEVVFANEVKWHTDVKHALQDAKTNVFENEKDDSLVVLNAKVSYSGLYTCLAKNEVGTAEATSKITIQPAVDNKILVPPKSQTWFTGFTGTLDCRTKDQIVTWTTPRMKNKNREYVAGQASESGKYFVTSEGTLFVYDVSEHDQGTYTCKNGISSEGETAVRTAKIVVEKALPPFAPLIQLGSSDQRIVPGGNIVLLCEGLSEEKVTISWSKDNQPFRATESTRYSLEPSGTLLIKNAIKSDAGEYTCTAKSVSGTTNQSSSLEIMAQGGIEESYPVESLPGPPATAPYASFVNTTCVHLHWAPPMLNQHLIRYYRIEHYIYGLQSWTTVQIHVTTTDSWVCNLHPGRTYLFVARAMNDYGYGHASPISAQITLMDLFPEKPESMIPLLSERLSDRLKRCDITVLDPVPVSPTSLRVSWKVLRYPTVIKGFRLHFSSSTHYAGMDVSDFEIITNPSERSHILSNLLPWTTYNVSVQPFNKDIFGLKSPWRVVFMPTVPPSAAPYNVLKQLDPKTGVLNISWTPPPQNSWNGHLLGFNILVTSVDVNKREGKEAILNRNVSFDAYTVSVNVSIFKKEDVLIKLAAFNEAGIGLYSKPMLFAMENGGSAFGATKGGNGGNSADEVIKEFYWIYACLGVITIILVGGVIFLIWRNCARCHSSRPGRGKRLRPLVCGEEKTYTGSMGTYYYYFYHNPEELLRPSNGIGTSEAVDLESISPQSKLMQNYLNMHPHNMPTAEMAHAAGYKYHHPSNSPCSGGTSINTPVHIEPGLHSGLSHSRSGIGRTPDLIRVPSPVHNNMNPEYAEIPGGGVYEMAAPSSMSSDNCIECQRERAALAAAAVLNQPPPTMTAVQYHHNRVGGQPHMGMGSGMPGTILAETCLVSHAGTITGGGSISSGCATPAAVSTITAHNDLMTTSSAPNSYSVAPHHSVGTATGMLLSNAAVVAAANNMKFSVHSQPPVIPYTSVSQLPSHNMGICPPMSNTQYHQLADNDYTKLDESISDSDPEANTPPPPHTPHSNNSIPVSAATAAFSYDIGAHTTTLNNNNRNSTHNAHPQHSNNSPTTSASFLAGGTLPPTSGDQLNRPRGLEGTTSSGTAAGAISRPRMGISSTIPAALGRSVASLPPYATNDVC